MRLIVVEDERIFADALRTHLTREGHAVDWVDRVEGTEAALACNDYDCLVLDLNLPDGSGQELLRRARQRAPSMASVVISGRRLVDDRITLLDLGADDYLVKPIDLDEVSARIRAVTRRVSAASSAEHEFRHGPLRVVPGRRLVYWHERQVTVTNREFCLLETFLRHRGEVLSRSRLEEAIYSWDDDIGSNAVEVHIHHLRRKLSRGLIVSIRNCGYHLAPAESL